MNRRVLFGKVGGVVALATASPVAGGIASGPDPLAKVGPTHPGVDWIGYPVQEYLLCPTCGALCLGMRSGRYPVAEDTWLPVIMEKHFSIVEVGGVAVQGRALHPHRVTTAEAAQGFLAAEAWLREWSQ